MKKAIITAFFAIAAAGINAQVKMPAPSPTQTIKQEFGIGSIELKYSRPSAKGRKVFGDLVPLINYGARVPMEQPSSNFQIP
jgi:hypothetical protein